MTPGYFIALAVLIGLACLYLGDHMNTIAARLAEIIQLLKEQGK